MSGSCRCGSCPIGASQPGHFGGPFPCCQGTLHLLLHRTSPEPDASQMLFWGRTGREWGFFPPSLCWYPAPSQPSPWCGPAGLLFCPAGKRKWAQEPRAHPRAQPLSSRVQSQGAAGPPGLSGLLAPRGVSPESIPLSQAQQDPEAPSCSWQLPALVSGSPALPLPFSPSSFPLSSSPFP